MPRACSRAPALAAAALVTAVLATAALVSACGGPAASRPAPPAAAPTAAAVPATPAQALALLSDSWVTDGTRGYFVDNARDAANPPFSLYSTYWQLRLAQWSGAGTAGVRAGAVQGWIGRALAGDLTASALPAIAQIGYAAGILAALNAHVPVARVAAAVEGLRSGGQYRTGMPAAPDWGATALAVGVLVRLHAPVPAPVLGAVRSALGGGSPVGDLPEFIAFVQVVGELGRAVGVPPAVRVSLVSTAEAALSQASGTADAAWLVQADDLRAAARLLGVAAPAVSARTCARLVGADGGVRLPGQRGPDPQATLAALGIGCAAARVPPEGMHGRAGWPTAAAAAHAVPASAAAARLAREAGVLAPFAEPLEREVAQAWVPAQRRPAHSLAAQVAQANLRILAGLLGGATAREVARALPGPAPPAVSPAGGNEPGAGDFAMLLYLLNLDYPVSHAAGPAWTRARALAAALAQRGGPASMTRAAWLELAARMFREPALHRRALALAAELRPVASSQGDLTDATIGMWVQQALWPSVPASASAGAAKGSLPGLAVLAAIGRRDFGSLFPAAL